ncbi:hypothetical protein GIB67_007378 [Kingdonia uniflora]|uniref:Uncharacterized protein n=1 Tax=Kingdonia uniflora TaxID=39325 RepID=A0A7J7NXC8_9MAGN|nr:hypothetical protein GIB67_007378 [Kingdonia uniflora]
MGRPPCCDKIGLKKGPWTPEEDILLVSYIQEHGPGNWRAVPSNTGLLRCSKSCRLRWTNYLRPGIKRGNFTDQEESMIIHLQALLGNRWAAIASYLPERTDNDIKNYWNTHLRKKLKKLQNGVDDQSRNGVSLDGSQPISRGQWERRLQTDMHMAKQALFDALSLDKSPNNSSEITESSNGYYSNTRLIPSATYASSTENISRLLQGWMENSPKNAQKSTSETTQRTGTDSTSSGSPEALESFFGFESSISDVDETTNSMTETKPFEGERKASLNTQVPLSLLEKWLFEEAVSQDQDMVGVSLDDMAHQLL